MPAATMIIPVTNTNPKFPDLIAYPFLKSASAQHTRLHGLLCSFRDERVRQDVRKPALMQLHAGLPGN